MWNRPRFGDPTLAEHPEKGKDWRTFFRVAWPVRAPGGRTGLNWAMRRHVMDSTIKTVRGIWLAGVIVSWFVGLTVGTAAPASTAGAVSLIDFNRDIRPILSENCFACHGPDEGRRKSGLRLDIEAEAFKELKSGRHALIPGDVEHSTLVTRLLTKDEDDLMPPPKSGKKLTEREIGLLKTWVKSGAKWKQHWSFLPPETPAVPKPKNSRWVRNEVDAFVADRMERAGMQPAPEADRATLIRRVKFDLTGLPPTIEEVDQFLSDRSPAAYEQLVDRLVKLPQYGERMAANWLDLARYADTSGYHFDGVRFMWLWRDWVIQAFNDNKPYDAFTVEQLAGDLLPNPTQSQRIATGFVRNNMTNDEGGADPDEYLNKYVVDRVNTLGTVWLGMTVGCTECHDHKYDPMSTKEFYRLYAFFHNVPEKGLDRIRSDNPPPRLPVPSSEQAVKFVEADFAVKDGEKTLQDRTNELGETQEKWERETQDHPPAALSLPVGSAFAALEDSLSLVRGTETITGKSKGPVAPAYEAGRPGRALKLESGTRIEWEAGSPPDVAHGLTVAAWIKRRGNGTLVTIAGATNAGRGLEISLADGRPRVRIGSTNEADQLRLRAKDSLPENQWSHVTVTWDGSNKADGLRIWIGNRARDVDREVEKLQSTVPLDGALSVGGGFTGAIDGIRVIPSVLPAELVTRVEFDGWWDIVARSRGHRTDEERGDLSRVYRERYAVDYLRAEAGLAKARRVKDEFYSKIPTSLVMEEMDPPRDTFQLVRGDFRNKGERVTAGTPSFLPPLPEGPANRLTLARWLVATNHPLTARVAVNRWWGMFFGTGLVKTANDFGSQGEWPSHPELLDWLSVRFRDGVKGSGLSTPNHGPHAVSAWDVRELVRLIVTSSTYRQSAAVTPVKLEKDPYNRLLSRGPRLRLDAEFVRDNALAVSGLLNRKIGGPSVKPYQPAGIWDGTDSHYEQDHGDSLYRRGMYVFWRRSAHYPSFATFDAPNREVCTFLRQRTQTPLQSLVLMNDPVFVEAARALADRVIREEPKDRDRRLVRAFRHVLGRPPARDELAVLSQTLDRQLDVYRADVAAAKDLIRVGESKASAGVDPAELAAYTAVANVLMNLNETLTH